MIEIKRDGPVVSLQYRRNGSKAGELRMWRTGTDDLLVLDTVNIISAKARESILSGFDDDVRDQVSALLVEAAVELQDATEDGGVDGGDDRQQGTAISFEEIEPWDEPVDGVGLAAELVKTITRYVILPEGGATACALWVLHAHAHDAAQVSPILGITSPEKRCGKSTLLYVLTALVPRALPTSNITPAALYRSIESFRPTMLVDEVDTFLADREELRGVLNDGHVRGLASVVRTVGEDFEPRRFSVWCPKVLSGIGKLPETLADRSVEIRMERRSRDQAVDRLRLDRLGDFHPIRRRAARWTADHMATLRDADPAVPDLSNDRAADNWRPLLAIADAIGGRWPETARRAAVVLSGGARSEGEDSIGVMLLRDVRAAFGTADRLTSEALVDVLVRMEDRPWPEFGREKRPISKRTIAGLLKRFRITPKVIRVGDETPRGYDRKQFAEAWSRYTPDGSATSATSVSDNDLGRVEKCNTTTTCCTSESGVSASEIRDVADVADREGVVRDADGSQQLAPGEFERRMAARRAAKGGTTSE